MNKYITYEVPFQNKVFNEEQMKKLYDGLVDKNEYPDFECWINDMLKSGVFEEVK